MTTQKKSVEKWRALPGYIGFEASTLAHVRRTKDQKILIPTRGRGWVRRIVFAEYHCSRSLHRLIANTFLGPCPKGRIVTFKDNDRLNCQSENLSYASPEPYRRSASRSTKGGLQKKHGQQVTEDIWHDHLPETERILKHIDP